MKKNKIYSTALSAAKAISIPIIIWVIFEILDRAVTGLGVINTVADVKTLLRNLITSYAFAMAINANLSGGRMDLSIGGQMYVGVIFGGTLALNLGWGGIGILLCAMFIGGLCGLLIGELFIHIRILPMVLGLGMTLVFECICFAINNQQGVTFFGKAGTEILSSVSFIIIVALLLLAVTTFLFQYSSYGYKLRAIQGSQKLASDAGINIFSNCVFCYIIAGVLAGCAGVFETAYKGGLTPVLGMGSSGVVFTNMFPMMLGIWIGSFINNTSLGILVGSLSIRILIIGLSRLGLGTSTQNLLLFSLFLVFMIINTNKSKIAYRRARKKRIALAKKTRADMAALEEMPALQN